MSPLLSVVVPFYGVEDYIGACLESIQNQRLTDIEVILVDDGSPDGSRAVAEQFVEKDSRFRIVTQDNAGLGPARNTGTAHASGEFLTFVDSDDLVTVRGFERMVDGLNASGSSFAGGNAKRFNNSSGVRQSWSHRHAFAHTRMASHILEFPTLARDRMVWNKIYRRSFWDQFGYEFPAIRYEDYPVTLKAHLEAVTVDVHSEPVYYWRERESGDSITQQAYRYDNLLDRVISAEMVLETVDRSTAPVRRHVYGALNESDFVTIVQAFASVPDEEAPALLELGQRLADRLTETVIARSHPFSMIQYHALMAGDVPLLRELADYRGGGGLRGAVRATRNPRMPWRREYPYPGLERPSTPRRLYAVSRREIKLRTKVTDLRRDDGSLQLTGTAEIRHLPSGPETTIEVEVGQGSSWTSLPVRQFETFDSHGDRANVGFEVTVTPAQLRLLAAAGKDTTGFQVTVRSGRLTRKGLLHGAAAGSPRWPSSTQVSDGLYVQPATTSKGHFVLSWLRNPWRLEEAHVDGSDLVLELTGPGGLSAATTLGLAATRDAEELVVPVAVDDPAGGTRASARIPVADILASVDHDDPFLQQSVRVVRLDLGQEQDPGQEQDLGQDQEEEAQQPPQPQPPQLLLWQAAEREVGHVLEGRHLVRLTRSHNNRVNIVEGPVKLIADSASVEGEGVDAFLVVSGANWTGARELAVAWRQFLPDSDDFVEQQGELVVEEDRWTLRTPLRPLAHTTSDSRDLHSTGEWVLFFGWDGHAATAVAGDPFLCARLPLRYTAEGRQGTLAPRDDTLHFQVSDAT